MTSSKGSSHATAAAPNRLSVAVSGIDLRIRGMYSGSFDAQLTAAGSLASPQVGGQLVVRQGTAYPGAPCWGCRQLHSW